MREAVAAAAREVEARSPAAGATAASVLVMGAAAEATWLWRHGDGDTSDDQFEDVLAADPLVAAAAAELPASATAAIRRWVERHYAELVEIAETTVAFAAILGSDDPDSAAEYARQAGRAAAGMNGGTVADAVICGALAEVRTRVDAGAGPALDLYTALLTDPLVGIAVAERGIERVGGGAA